MALPTASENVFPKVIILEGVAPSSPSAGDQKVYIDSTSHHLSRKDSSGAIVDLETNQSSAATSIPTFVAVGASATGTGALSVALPAGHVANDILLVFVQSDNETITAPTNYVQLGPQIGIGTAAAASATRGAIFWKRDNGSETDPITVADTGDHTLAQIMAIRGCVTTGDPFVSIGQTRKTTASVTGTGAAGATAIDNCLVVQAFWHALDSASAVFSAWTNASLSSVTERIDVGTTDGNGGGIGVATGGLATAGPFVSTTVTETSTVDTGSTFYLIPAGTNLGQRKDVDIQIFTTAGFADTWTKPSGARLVQMTCIGSGASGSGGRAASVAAGGGGGGGGGYIQNTMLAAQLAATLAVTAGAGGAATANSDGATSNAGNVSQITTSGVIVARAGGGAAAGASSTGSGGLGGNGGGIATTATAAGTESFGTQSTGGGTGGTTAQGGGAGRDYAGGAGAGGGTTQAASTGGSGALGAGGGGGGRSNTTVGGGGAGGTNLNAGGATVGAVGTTSPYPDRGGGGGAGGTSGTGPGGAGGWPGGGGGGGGTVSSVAGGAGGDGVVVITTLF